MMILCALHELTLYTTHSFPLIFGSFLKLVNLFSQLDFDFLFYFLHCYDTINKILLFVNFFSWKEKISDFERLQQRTWVKGLTQEVCGGVFGTSLSKIESGKTTPKYEKIWNFFSPSNQYEFLKSLNISINFINQVNAQRCPSQYAFHYREQRS